jgi:peptidoglycan/xylan/chitin deacetylase (PgdA/CDA1 family)
VRRAALAICAVALLTGMTDLGPGGASYDPTTHAVLRLGRYALPVFCGGDQGRYVALTFDDGPGLSTETVVRILRAHGAGATFFAVGTQLRSFPHVIRAAASVGAVGDHTWTHPHLTRVRTRRLRWELRATDLELQRQLRRPTILFRPPYAAHDRRVDRMAKRYGLLEVLWSIDTRDSRGASAAAIVRSLALGVKPGSIVLMHENHPATIAALPRILRLLHARHLLPVTVPELLAVDPPSLAQRVTGVC